MGPLVESTTLEFAEDDASTIMQLSHQSDE